MLKLIFVPPDGKLRAIWRATIYYTVGTFVVFSLLDRIFIFAAQSMHLGTEFTAANVGFGELRNFFAALICTGTFALYEQRRVDSYGLPLNRAFGWRTFEGAAAGIVLAAAVALGMLALGGMQIKGLAGRGSALMLSAHGSALPSLSASPKSSGSGPIFNKCSGKASASGRRPR